MSIEGLLCLDTRNYNFGSVGSIDDTVAGVPTTGISNHGPKRHNSMGYGFLKKLLLIPAALIILHASLKAQDAVVSTDHAHMDFVNGYVLDGLPDFFYPVDITLVLLFAAKCRVI